jgi:hypothetical protein
MQDSPPGTKTPVLGHVADAKRLKSWVGSSFSGLFQANPFML